MTIQTLLLCAFLGLLAPTLPLSARYARAQDAPGGADTTDANGGDRVGYMLFEADMDLEGGHVIEALATLSEALELDPDRLEAHLLFGQAVSRGLELGVFDDVNAAAANAMTHFRWVLDHDPDNAEAKAGLDWLDRLSVQSGPYLTSEAGIKAWAQAQEDLSKGDTKGAIQSLRDAIAAEPTNPEVVHVHRLLGKLLLEDGDTDEAITTLDKAVSLGADDDEVHFLLGQAWEKKTDTKQALHHYDLAMQYSGQNQDVVDRIIAILGSREQEDLSPEELSLLGRAYVNGDKYDKAVVVLDQSLAADSLFASKKALGVAEFFRKNDARAMKILKEAHKDDAQDLEVTYYIGALQLRGGDVDAGRSTLRQLLQQDPNNPNAMRLLGLSLADDPDQAQSALKFLKAAHRAGAQIAGYPCLIGTLYMHLGQRFNASTMFLQCIDENPDFTGAYLGLGIVADDRGQTSQAIKYLQEYIDREPDPDRGAAFRLGVAYLKSGQDKKGFSTLRNIVKLGGGADSAAVDTLTDTELLEATSFFLASARRFEDAIFIGEMLLSKDPDNAIYNNNLAMSYADANHKVGRAHALALKANKLAPDNPGHMDTLGWTLIRMNKLDEAEVILKRSLKLAKEQDLPNLSEIYYHLGVLYHQEQRHREALDALTEALKDPPTEFLRREIETVAEASRQLLEQEKSTEKN